MKTKEERKIGLGKLDHTVVIPDFFAKGENLEKHQLGWDYYSKLEAQTSVSKKIFEYYVVEMRMNMVFYYLGDCNFYGIHAEITPTPIFRFKKMPNSKHAYDELGKQDTHDFGKGEILHWIDECNRIWDEVKIDGKNLEEVLQNSYIVNIS